MYWLVLALVVLVRCALGDFARGGEDSVCDDRRVLVQVSLRQEEQVLLRRLAKAAGLEPAVLAQGVLMEGLRPIGASEHSGTYLAHLTAVLAALAALDEYSQPGFYERLNGMADRFSAGFQTAIERCGVPVTLQHVGPRFGLYFGLAGSEITNYRQAAKQNTAMLHCFIAACIERGVYFHVSAHHGFSAAHTDADLDQVLAVVEAALLVVARAFPTG